MSEILQAGRHPDADQLNAFVEHTLPAHEQQQTLAHLAICEACRQIVALSVPPADESSILQPAVRHRWHPAWAGIPALAALLMVALFVRSGEKEVRQASGPGQIADVRKPAAPSESARSVAPNGAPPAQKRRAAQTKPAPLAEKRQAPASAGALGVISGTMGGIAGGIAPKSSEEPVNGRAVDLPSRLAVLSMASRGNRRLVIDTGNHLFFSEDEGRNWKAVPSPWKGLAVAVSLTSRVSSGNGAAALKMRSRPAAATGAALSGIITDPTGAVIPGATVAATNSAAEIVRSVVTDNRGQFRTDDLVPGSYRIEVQATGFETQSFSAEVAPGQQAVADVTLRLGSAAQTVTVQSSLAATNPVAQPQDDQTLSRFELSTDDGERWISTDGQTWTRE